MFLNWSYCGTGMFPNECLYNITAPIKEPDLMIDLYASSSLSRVILFCLSVSLILPGLSDVCAMNLFAYVRRSAHAFNSDFKLDKNFW